MFDADNFLNELADGQRLEDLRNGYRLDMPLASERMDEDEKARFLAEHADNEDITFVLRVDDVEDLGLTYEQLAAAIAGEEVRLPLGILVRED